MKKLMGVFLVVMLVFGVAGQASAYFEFGNVQLVAMENPTDTLPVPSSGNEVHFDLGLADPYMDLTVGSFSVDTGIVLGDFSGAADWSDVYVGIFGGGIDATGMGIDTGLFSTGSDNFTVGGAYGTFQTAVLYNSGAFMGATTAKHTQAKDQSTSGQFGYWNQMDVAGNNPGSYAGWVTVNGSTFGGEVQASYVDPFGFYEGNASGADLVGYWTLTLDPGDNSLIANYNAVPIPASVLLLGSGLLGLFGIRRRN